MAGHLELVASNMVDGLKAAGAKFLPQGAFRFRTFMTCGLRDSATLDGEIEVEIIYTVRPGSAPSHDDPGSPAEVTVHALRAANGGTRIDLTWMGTTWIEEDEEMVAALLADADDQHAYLAEQAADARREEARDAD